MQQVYFFLSQMLLELSDLKMGSYISFFFINILKDGFEFVQVSQYCTHMQYCMYIKGVIGFCYHSYCTGCDSHRHIYIDAALCIYVYGDIIPS